MFEFINMVLLDLVILWHYWRAGNKKQNDAAKILTNVHRKARAKIVDDKAADEEERQTFMRLHEHHEQMADQ